MALNVEYRSKLRKVLPKFLSRGIREVVDPWIRQTTTLLIERRPRRVAQAPAFGRHGRPQQFTFIHSEIPDGWEIKVTPPQRAIAVYAMEFGGKRYKYPIPPTKALKIVKKDLKTIRIRKWARPSPPSPWVVPLVLKQLEELPEKIKSKLRIEIMTATEEKIIV